MSKKNYVCGIPIVVIDGEFLPAYHGVLSDDPLTSRRSALFLKHSLLENKPIHSRSYFAFEEHIKRSLVELSPDPDGFSHDREIDRHYETSIILACDRIIEKERLGKSITKSAIRNVVSSSMMESILGKNWRREIKQSLIKDEHYKDDPFDPNSVIDSRGLSGAIIELQHDLNVILRKLSSEEKLLLTTDDIKKTADQLSISYDAARQRKSRTLKRIKSIFKDAA